MSINKNFCERVRGKPISKIFGIKEFYSYEFFTNSNVLDPRPESETLVDVAKKILRKTKSTTHILELCWEWLCNYLNYARTT